MSPYRLAILAAAATGIQVGANIVATRFAVGQIGPISLALLRYAIGCLILAPVVLAIGRPRFACRDIAPIAVLGILQFGVLIALLNLALQYIPAARASLIFATFPLLTLVLGAATRRESLSARVTIGVTISILGVALTLGESAVIADTGGPDADIDAWIGAGAALGAAFTGAVCSVLYRPYLQRYPTLPVGFVAMAASVAFLAVLATGEGFFNAWPQLDTIAWAAVLFIAVSSAGGYLVWLYALRHAPPTRVTMFLGLSPVTAALLGTLLLGEPLTAGVVGGLVLVVAGLGVALR
ncbi:DMT family transporter [Thalassobaculum sp.]|uniref:DMT family transporter n=1 Tax=Thalassobaculum sp. TaxID=2022740 RepID=UPI0032EEFE30